MRKLFLIVVFALLASLTSCAHMRGGDFRQTRDSVYKVEVTMKLDLKPLKEWVAKKEEERKKKEQQQQFPWGLWKDAGPTLAGGHVQLTEVQKFSDFHVISESDDTAMIGWSGTGWVAGYAPGRSYVMTAGHVCESKDVYPIQLMDLTVDDAGNLVLSVETIELPIIEKKHVMMGRDGLESAPGTIMRDEDMGDDFNGNDLCMLGVSQYLGPAIPVGDSDPDYGDTCTVVGAPTGLWGGGIAVPSEALFAGRGAVFGTEPDGLTFNGLLAPGNSGSAVVCDGKAVGVISLGSTRFKSLIHAVPYERIRTFMGKALHRK